MINKAVYSVTLVAVMVMMGSCGSCKRTSRIAVQHPEALVQHQSLNVWIDMFNGEDLSGWRGYNQDAVPALWSVENGAIKISATPLDSTVTRGGEDLIYGTPYGNFEMEFEWKVEKGGHSGVFYLAQELSATPISYSAPKYQITDNATQSDTASGRDGSRLAGSLYEMMPPRVVNAKAPGQWNKAKIMVFKGIVVHSLNEVVVVEYHLWTPQWKLMLENSAFNQNNNAKAYSLLLRCGGEKKQGYIGLQDGRTNVWFRNLRIRSL